MYLDQRSTVLAVDNLNGSKVLGRTLRVDHTRNYEQPKGRDEEGEVVEPEEQSMNALPSMVGGPAGRGAIEAGGEEDVDEEDPMAAYIRSERVSSHSSTSLQRHGGKGWARTDAPSHLPHLHSSASPSRHLVLPPNPRRKRSTSTSIAIPTDPRRTSPIDTTPRTAIAIAIDPTAIDPIGNDPQPTATTEHDRARLVEIATATTHPEMLLLLDDVPAPHHLMSHLPLELFVQKQHLSSLLPPHLHPPLLPPHAIDLLPHLLQLMIEMEDQRIGGTPVLPLEEEMSG